TCDSLTGGTFNGTLTINHNAFGSPATYPITCTITDSTPITGGETGSNGSAPEIALFDPAISKLGFLVPGQSGALGEQLEWVISLSNVGNAAGSNVLVTDTLNANLRIDRVDAPNATVNISGQTVSVTFASIQPGQSFQFSIFTTVTAGTSAENTACVQAAGIAIECSTASPIRSLPHTGEAPLWANFLRGFVVMLLLATGLYSLYRRRITTQ
ncbi:MAG: DUF11 domain-containing protein, partial [Anaerolineae bacterium]|nr:DUF11 domain-containing protein [Anaerolineae bacterium]